MQYRLIINSDYVRKMSGEEIWIIPNDPDNSDWQRYQAWLTEDPENNIPLPANEE